MLFAALHSSQAAISFEITELLDGTTNWELLGSDTTFTVSSFNPTGLQGEQVILPKGAFDFDYSANFTINFDAPIGRVTNLTTGAFVSLNRIRYTTSQNQLQLTGGLLDRSVGDQLQITNFASSNISIQFDDVNATVPTGYFQAGAWHNDSQIDITPTSVPEPSSFALLGSVAALCFCRRGRRQ